MKFTLYETWACCIPVLEARLLLMNTTIKVVSKVNRRAARIVPIRIELLPLSVLIVVTELETVNVISSVVSMFVAVQFVAVEVTWPTTYHRVFSIIWIWMTKSTTCFLYSFIIEDIKLCDQHLCNMRDSWYTNNDRYLDMLSADSAQDTENRPNMT